MKNKKPHSYPDIVFSHLVASLALLYPYDNKALPIWLSFYKHRISIDTFVVAPRNLPTPSEEDKIHYFW